MGLRKLIPSGKRSRPSKPAAATAPGSDAERALGRAQLLMQCTRTILRALDERELARALCDLLINSAIYAEASVELAQAGDRRKNSTLRSHKLRADQITLPLVTSGRTVAVLRLRTSGKRAPDEGELEQLQALMDDAAYALGRLQEDARRSAVAASERGVRQTFEHAGVGIARVSVDGHFAEVNQKFCDMLGYTREELTGRSTREVTVPEDYGPGPAFRAEAAQGRATLSIAEKRYVHKDGSHVWVRRTMTPAYDGRGAVHGVISVVECITERKAAEEAVRIERTLLRTIVDALPHYIYVKDNRGHFTLANKAWLDWRGLSAEQVHGKTVHDVFPASLARQLEAQDRPILEDGTPLLDREQHLELAPNGQTRTDRWSSTTKVPLRDTAGNIVGLVGISRDITDSKLAEEAVRRERALLRTIIDAVPDYIYVKDTHCRYQLANIAWLRARRIHPDELPGKTSFDIFPASVAQRLHHQDQAVLEHGIAMLDNEQPISLLSDDGSEPHGWSSATKVPMRDGERNIVGVVGISRDITARRRMERERAMEHAVAQVLSESRSVEETMPRLIRTICEAMGWAYGARWVWDTGLANLRRAEWWCEVEPDLEAEDRHYWLELRPEQSGGLVHRAWADARPTWLSDITQVNTFRRKTSCLKLGFRSAFAFPILAHDERVGVMEFFGRDVREPDEALLQVTGVIANQIGQFIRRKQAEETLQENEQQLRAMFENADVGIAMTGLDMRYLRVNDQFCNIVGYDREELLQMTTSDVNLIENVRDMQQTRQQIVSAEVHNRMIEKQLVRKDRSLVWVSIAVSLVRASDGAPRYFIAVVQDISESRTAAAALKESEEQFRQLAHYDILTKLPNRALFYDRLAQSIAQAKRNRWALAVLFIDVDRFKHVNDTFGHAAGDQLLKLVSQRLSECVRSDDTVGRLSGDEFAIVLTRLGAAEDAAAVAKKIVEVLNTPFQLEGAELFVTASIGITVYPSDSTEQDTLIRNADVAMYRAKERGRNNYQFYTPEMNTRTREMLNMEGELRRALERDELVLHYQPKVSLATGRITGVEALLRWRHPERGLVPPVHFIPLLEETGLIVQAGDWVLRAVCRQLKQWERDGIRAVPVAINLSPRQFLAPDLAQNIKQIIEESEVSAELIEVEITESSVMANAQEAIRTLEYLESLGVQTAIDDFGTGYSSLSYLKRFPLRALKIDRSFVRDVTTDTNDAAITQAVISMAHSLGLKVVAEGVETEAQLAFLARYACDEVQGYLFSRPVPGEECGALIADDSRIGIVIEAVKAAAIAGTR